MSKPRQKIRSPSLRDLEKIERMFRDADISPEDYQALKDELKRNRRRNEGAGDNPLDNIYEEP